MANNPRGFVPTRHLGGSVNFRTNRYSVSANNPTSIMVGKAVYLESDGHVRVVRTSGGSVNERGVLGVVRSIYNSSNRPLTHNLPSTANILPASTAGYVDVIDDPDVVFLVDADASATQANIGQYVRVTAGSDITAAGIPGWSVRIADATASSVGHKFMIVGLGPNETLDTVGEGAFQGLDNPDVEVIISDHHFRRAFKRVGVY